MFRCLGVKVFVFGVWVFRVQGSGFRVQGVRGLGVLGGWGVGGLGV